MAQVNLTENEKRTVLAVFDSLVKLDYGELNKFLGSITIMEMQSLYYKLHYEPYCIRHNIRYEDMTDDDFVDAYLEEMEY